MYFKQLQAVYEQKFLECLTWEFIKKYESTQLW
jgi:hypothetical protein